MWSTCSIDTGHASTHAPQVTQSQIISVGTPLPAIGSVLCAKTWSRMPMISSFGESSLPVAFAGHASWQRPHSVHEKPSSTCFHVRSATVAAPKRSSSSGRSKRSGSSRPARARAPEPDVDRGDADVQVLRVRQVDEEAEDGAEVRPDEEALRRGARREDVRQRVREERPARRPLVQPGGDQRRVPADQRDHDGGDQPEDQVRLAAVRALEAARPHHRADHDGGRDADEHEDDEEVDEQHVPALVPEPRQRRVHVDRGDHRHEDRREEDEEAPEDERVHQPRHDALQQRALAEHVDRFVADARRRVAGAVRRARGADEPREEQRAPAEQRARHDEQRRESDRAGGDAYVPRAFLSSALMAGTISCRSPITA